MGVAPLAQSDVAAVALGIVLGCNARPMIDGITQTDVCGVAPDDHAGLATLLRHGCDARQSPERLVIATTERPGSLGEQYGEIDPANSRHGLQYLYIVLFATVLGSRRGRLIQAAT